MPIWVILTLLSAFSLATSDALTKRIITRDNEYVIGWFRLVIVGDPVSPAGAAGIVLIGLGGFTLNLSNLRSGIFGPLRAVVRERGSLYMLSIALVYGFTSSLGKLAIDHSSPAFFGTTYFLALALLLLPFIVRRSGLARFPSMLRENARAALLPGLFDAVATLAHVYAMSMTNVAYMIALKRTSLLMGSLYGFLLFGERQMRERMAGAILMFAGFVVIVLFS